MIPLKQWNDPAKGAGKAPILSEWTAYATSMPSKAMQDLWVHSYPDNNIGLPFGPASGLCAIDIDTEDEALTEAILSALPTSPWKRVGKKGMGLIYRWQGQKNFKLRDSENEMIVEFLGLGNQMVMPPSIHPDTGKPYVANCNLWEVLDTIPALPVEAEKLLRDALGPVVGGRGLTLANSGRSGPLEVVPSGNRDIQMVRHAGYLSRIVLGIDRNAKLTLMEAINHMHTWTEDFTARVAGDSMDPGKGVSKLLEFLMRDLEGGKTLPDGWDEGLTDVWTTHPTIAALRSGNEVARWDVQRAIEWLATKETELGEDKRGMMSAMSELIGDLAKDENFTEMEFGVVAKNIQRTLGKDFAPSLPDMKKLFREERRGDGGDAGADQEEIARYILEVLGRGGEVRYDTGYFWQWNGSCFQKLDDDRMMEAAMVEVKGNVLSRRFSDYAAIVNVMRVLARAPLVEVMEAGVNFANGYLDTNGELHDHSPKWGATFTMPFNYVPQRATECHKWLEYLETTWGDDADYGAKVAALQEAFAATMFGLGASYQRAILLFGKAGSGKSQALEVLREMMPEDAVCQVPPHMWREKYSIADMVNRTLNVCGELPESKAIDGAVFKEVIDGTIQQVERKFKDPFAMKPKASHWFGSNFIPKSRDTSRGFNRRWLILEFNRIVPEEEMIRDYAKVLVADEREAIAAWAVLGLKRLLENRDYTKPASHEQRVEQMLLANNSVAGWLTQTEKIRPVEGAVADARECFDQYQFYIKEVARGFYVSFERFKEMMDELGYDEERYRDPMGVMRFQFRGLQVVEASLEEKWRLAS